MIKFHGTRYHCQIHGDQGSFIGVLVDFNGAPLPESLKSRSQRKYCMACWIDMMDRELEPLQEIGGERKE